MLTLLRKESGLTQKEIASSLGVSQALLSHYEKGTRECGLAFVVKAAAFYGVSCDFLLGMSPDRSGSTLQVEDIPDVDDKNDSKYRGSVLPALNKRLIINSLNIVFDLLQQMGDKTLTTEMSNYLMISVYKLYRILFSANPLNPQNAFVISDSAFLGYSNAEMTYIETRLAEMLSEKAPKNSRLTENIEKLKMSTLQIGKDYPLFATSLFNMLQIAEKAIEPKDK